MEEPVFNIPDPWVAAAFALSLLSCLLCVVWGLFKWNEVDAHPESEQTLAEWSREEERVEQEL